MAIYTLTGETKEINVLGRYASVKNNGEETIYASCASDLSPEAPDVVPIQAGESVIVRDCRKKLYVSGSGLIAVVSGNEPVNFFKPAPKGGSGGGGSGDGITQQQLNDTLKFYATNTSVDTKLENYATSESVSEGLSGKVDTIEGMGLSSNDFTDADKAKLDGLENYDDTGIKADIASFEENKADKSDTLTSLINLGLSNGNGSRGIVSIPADSAPCEIGQYLDFHRASTSEDYTVRLEALENGDISMVRKSGISGGTIHCNADTVGGYTAEQLIQSNPNLLLNPDFKVNQRGKTEYSGYTSTVDRWEKTSAGIVTIEDDGVTLNNTDGTATMYWGQVLDLNLANVPITLSTSDSNGNLYTISGNGPAVSKNPLKLLISDIGSFYVDLNVDHYEFFFQIKVGKSIKIKWAKLEYGSVATSFVPPNPLEEILKCGSIENESQQVLYGDGKWANIPSNPNLLDNPDFRINQRGQNTYSVPLDYTGQRYYTVDRWVMQIHGTVSVDSSGVTITRGQIQDTDGSIFGTLLDPANFDNNYLNKTMTLSMYVEYMSEGSDFKMFIDGASSVPLKLGLNSVTVSSKGTNRWIGIGNFIEQPEGAFIKVKWVKLELGSVATTFVPPDPATELLKCQRYFEKTLATGLCPQSPVHNKWLTPFRMKATKRIPPTIVLNALYHNTVQMYCQATLHSDVDYVTLETLDGTTFDVNDFTYQCWYEASADL